MDNLCRNNNYVEILNFLDNYGGTGYCKPETSPTRTEYYSQLKERAQIASRMMSAICNSFASRYNLTLAKTIRWLNGNNRSIKRYFWGQLKHPNSNSPISISIFGERNTSITPNYLYRLALELDEKNARNVDYQAYKRYVDMDINTSLLTFYYRSTAVPQLFRTAQAED